MQMFEVDCAERALPVFEAVRPTDDRPRATVRACRLYLAGQISLEELHAAIRPAMDAAREVNEPAWFAAAAAYNAADYGNPYGGMPPSWHAVDAIGAGGGGQQAAEAERVWQVGRMLDLFLYGSEYQLPRADLIDVERRTWALAAQEHCLTDAATALQEVQRLVNWRGRDGLGLCDEDMANQFLRVVMEAELGAVDACFAAVPESALPIVRDMLSEFAARDYYDDQHTYIMDGRTIEQRQQHYRKMQPHYRKVGELLFSHLRGSG